MSNYQKSRKLGLQYRNGTSVYTTSLVANASLASNYNLTLPSVLPTVGLQALMADTSGNLSWTPALNTTTTNSFAASNNVTTATNVPNLTMTSTSYATTTLYVLVTAATNQSAVFTLTAMLTPTGTYNLTFFAQGDDTGIGFSMNATTGQVLYTSPVIAGFISLTFSWMTPKVITNYLPASTTSVFAAAAPQSTAASVTGLIVTIPSIVMTLYVLVSATTNLTQVVTLTIYTKGANNNYALAQTNVGDDTGIVFSIVPTTGQVQYLSPSFTGWTSTSIQWTNPATLTTTPITLSSLALTGPLQLTNAGLTVGSLAATVPTSTLSATTGSSFTLASQTIQDTATPANGTLTNFQSVYLGALTLSASNTAVTTTTASTLTIGGPPIPGTNETVNNLYAFLVQNGNALFANGYVITTGLPMIVYGGNNTSQSSTAGGNILLPSSVLTIVKSTGPSMGVAGSNVITIQRKGVYSIRMQLNLNALNPPANVGLYMYGSDGNYYALTYAYASSQALWLQAYACEELAAGLTLTPYLYNVASINAAPSTLNRITVTGHAMTM